MFSFIAALMQAGNVVIDKVILTRRQVAVHVFVPILFLFLFLLTAVLYPFLGHMSPAVFEVKNLVLFGLMILFALVWNFFYYRGIQSEKVQEFEIFLMFQPLITILMAGVFLRSELNIHVFLAALVASIFLILAQMNSAHIELKRGAICMITAVVFMSAELITIRVLLNYFSPVALYAVRTGVISLFFYIYYHPKMLRVSSVNIGWIFLAAFFGISQMILKFYGFERYGVVYTSLVLIIAPLLVYFASIVFFHEKWKARTFVSALVILGCIVYATVLGR